MRILALATLLAVAGCKQDEKLSENPAEAASQIKSWVPVGTSLADAKQIMERHEFSCAVKTNGTFRLQNLEAVDHLYCTRRLSPSLFGQIIGGREWQAVLVLKDGKISTVSVAIGQTGP